MRRMGSSLVFLSVMLAGQQLSAVAAESPKSDPQLKGKPLSAWVKLLSDTDPLVREEALNVLAETGPKAKDQAVEAIRPLLKDESAGIRQRAAIALWKVADDAEPALTMFRADLKDKDKDTRLRAGQYLVDMVDVRGAAAAVVEALRVEDSGLRLKIQGALRQAGQRGLAALLAGVENSDEAVAEPALLYLEDYLIALPGDPRFTQKAKDDFKETVRGKLTTADLKARLRVAQVLIEVQGSSADDVWPAIKEGCAAMSQTRMVVSSPPETSR